MLRLLQAFLQSAPQLVLQLYILLQRPRLRVKEDMFTAVAAACSLVSLIWAILAYSKSLRDFRQQGYKLSAVGLFFQVLWRISVVSSRVVAMVLFASYFKQWLFVAVGAHWIIMTLWLICQRTRFCTDEDGNEHPYREKLFSAVIGFIYIFCFFNTREGMTRKRVVLFFSIILVENSLFVSMWYPHRTFRGIMAFAALGVVWGGLVFGIVCMLMYYRFYHPSLPVQGIFLQKRSFDLEGEMTHTWVCCWCCPLRRSKQRNGALEQNGADGLIRHVNRSENHPPALELEILPRTPSWELVQEGLRVNGNHFGRTRSPGLASGPDFSPTNILVHNTPARPLGMASHPLFTSHLPRITVTGATPEVMSPRDSVSNTSLVTLKEVEMETLNNVQCPDHAARSTEDPESKTLDKDKSCKTRRGLAFQDDITYTSPRSPTAGEIISWFHPEQAGLDTSLDAEEENNTEKINYGSLSFGNRYSLVSSDCISLSSESSRSSVDSIVFADEGPGSSGVYIKKTLSDDITQRAMDEGIFSDERDSPAKASIPEDQDSYSKPSTPQASRVNAQLPALAADTFQDAFTGAQASETVEKVSLFSDKSDDDSLLFVEFLMDAPSSPLSSLKRRRSREAGNSVSSEDKESVESKPSNVREGSVSEQEDGHESESTDASSDSNYRRNRHRSCDEIETGASGVPSSPDEINKRHTFDFSQLSKSSRSPRRRRRRDGKYKRTKRKEFDNFVVTTLKPGKYGSLRRSIDRLAKIQEDTEETFLLNTEAALNACIAEEEELSSPTHDTSELQKKSEDDCSTKKRELSYSTDSSNAPMLDFQENRTVSDRDSFLKRKRIKRFLSKELVPGKFSSVRLSSESGPSDENFQIFHESEFSGRQQELPSTVSADSLPNRSRHSNCTGQRSYSGNRRKELHGKAVSLPDVIRSTGSKYRPVAGNNLALEKATTSRVKHSLNANLGKDPDKYTHGRDLVPVLNKRHTYDFVNSSARQVEAREPLFKTESGMWPAQDRQQRRSQSEVFISTRSSSVYV